MEKLIKHIADIIRPRCISDTSAELAAIDVITYLNNIRNKCECPNDIKTGWFEEKLCNICGRPEKQENIKYYKDQSECPICSADMDSRFGCVCCGYHVE